MKITRVNYLNDILIPKDKNQKPKGRTKKDQYYPMVAYGLSPPGVNKHKGPTKPSEPNKD